MSWASVCELDELVEGQGRYAEIGGFKLAVFLHEGRVYALDHRCPHAGGNIAGGHVENGRAVCPWHHWAFDLETGQMPGRPLVKVRTYPTRLLKRQGKPTLVQVEVPLP